MRWVNNTAKALLLAYAMSATPSLATEMAIASIPQSREELIIDSLISKEIRMVRADDIARVLKGHDDDVESAFKVINKLLTKKEIRYIAIGEEVKKAFFQCLDEGPPYSIDVDGHKKYKTLAPVDKLIYASASIINRDIHISLRLTEKVDIDKWFITAISIPSKLDFVIKPVKTDYGYDARLIYTSQKPYVNKITTFFKGIYADHIEAREDGTPNNKYMLMMIKNLKDNDLINTY